MKNLLLSLFLFTILPAQNTWAFNFKNFHEIAKGEYYRSGQLTDKVLKEKIQKYGIKSVINLRGESPGTEWYDKEFQAIQETGVRYVSIRMSAQRLPHREDLITLLDAFKTLPRPLLVHCKAGADRAGEAATIYALEYLKWPKNKALKMLSPKYLHFPPFMPAKKYFMKNIYQGEEWARTQYDPCQENYKYYDKAKFCPQP